MERVNAYSEPTENGGLKVDVEGMIVDLVTVAKAMGGDKISFID